MIGFESLPIEYEREKNMSSSTYTQRWTSVNDLTTNNHHQQQQQITSFFLQSTDPNTFTITLRPSQSLASLIDPVPAVSPSPSPPPPPVPPRPSEYMKRGSPSHVADMVHRFESLPARNHLSKPLNDPSSRMSPIVIVERTSHPSVDIPKRQPIIVCERITNHDRSQKSLFIPPAKICQEIPNVDSDTDSAIQTMPVLINKTMNDSITSSRSNTTDSNCSSSSSSDQQSLTNFSRPIPSTRLCTSEINLVDQYHRLSSPDISRSETNLSHNPNLPLKYKRESYCRLYG